MIVKNIKLTYLFFIVSVMLLKWYPIPIWKQRDTLEITTVLPLTKFVFYIEGGRWTVSFKKFC